MEIRVAVDDAVEVHGLMGNLVGMFGRAAVSFDSASENVMGTLIPRRCGAQPDRSESRT